MPTAEERAASDALLRDYAFDELYRVFRAIAAGGPVELQHVAVDFRLHPNGEPTVTLHARDGFNGADLQELMELAGPLELELDAGGALIYSCPSWPDPPF